MTDLIEPVYGQLVERTEGLSTKPFAFERNDTVGEVGSRSKRSKTGFHC